LSSVTSRSFFVGPVLVAFVSHQFINQSAA